MPESDLHIYPEYHIGQTVCGDWKIIDILSCKQYRALYQMHTLDISKQIKNSHYLLEKGSCGIRTYMDRSTFLKNAANGIFFECYKHNCSECRYAEQFRIWNKYQVAMGKQHKKPDRNSVNVGDVFGNYRIVYIIGSGDSLNHSRIVTAKNLKNGRIISGRFDLLDFSV